MRNRSRCKLSSVLLAGIYAVTAVGGRRACGSDQEHTGAGIDANKHARCVGIRQPRKAELSKQLAVMLNEGKHLTLLMIKVSCIYEPHSLTCSATFNNSSSFL